jgi:hypothetical protein
MLTHGVRRPAVVITGLIAVVLFTGCTGGQLEAENPPGPTSFRGISDPVSGTYTGTGTIELGEPPDNATHIDTRLTCLSAGNLIMEDGLTVICPTGSANTTALSSFELVPGKQSVTITAEDPSTKYKLDAVYQDRSSDR